jgi:hypothetical protein
LNLPRRNRHADPHVERLGVHFKARVRPGGACIFSHPKTAETDFRGIISDDSVTRIPICSPPQAFHISGWTVTGQSP